MNFDGSPVNFHRLVLKFDRRAVKFDRFGVNFQDSAVLSLRLGIPLEHAAEEGQGGSEVGVAAGAAEL